MIPARLQPILEVVRPLAVRFDAAGHRLYLVGGIVRDLVLGRELSGDIDLTTDARPEVTTELVRGWADAVWDQGARFGTVGVKRGDVILEITTHRAEAYAPESRKPDVSFAEEVELDLARRDFTVNAMALRITGAEGEAPELIDPHGGVADLAAGVLRTPLDPDVSFGDDPLRMLRAARFLAGYGLQPEPALVDAVKRLVDRLAIVSAERVRDELCKLLVVPNPTDGLWFLVDTGIADLVLPELPAMRVEQDPIHQHKDVLTHTLAVVAKTSPELILRMSALLHDVGKPKTHAIGPKGVSFHHHEVVGARMARERLRALRFSNEQVDDITQLVFLHLRFHGYGDDVWTDAAVRRYVRDAGPLLDRLNELTRCDCTTRNERKARQLSARMDALEARIADLAEREALEAIRPDLDGQAVMAHLGIGPGPLIGQALAMLLEARLDEGPLDQSEALARLDAWFQDRSASLPSPEPGEGRRPAH